jgi:trk system potassium uptake protein TrkH
MNVTTILWLVGLVLGVVAVAQVPSLALAVALGEPWEPFARSVALGLAAGAALLLQARRTRLALDHRSAFVAVTATWFTASASGAVPLLTHPELGLSAIDAFFESTSGFTTTGATVVSGLDRLPRSVLLWRSVMQWIGGMGIVLLGVAVLPVLGLGGMQLFRAEVPGPSKDKITPRIAETAKILWVLYLALTVTNAGLLILGGMSPFDAVCHAMTTVATAGFSTRDGSLGAFDSGFNHLVTIVFMLLGGTSFALLHRALTQGLSWSSAPELRAYVGIFSLASALVTLDLTFNAPERYATAQEALEHGVFQVASILTTTGYTTRDYAQWPPLSQAVLLVLFFVGGMAGSTCGGIKVVRVVVLAKVAFAQFFRLVHPRGVSAIKLGSQTLDDAIVMSVLGFIAMWMGLLMAGTAAIAFTGMDPWSSFASAAVALGNIGPGFGAGGPSTTYADFAPTAKLIMTALMILGRLEIYTALVILTPVFWRR